ncbi:MAG: Maf-like protein [Myxococcaceae bacterium]
MAPAGGYAARPVHPSLAGLYSELLLASTSPARRALMDALGLPYRAVPPEVDEEVPAGTAAPRAVAVLAERKARAVLAKHPGALVIGADQLVSLEGRTLGKPSDALAAAKQLQSLSGKTHDIYTALCVVGPAFLVGEVDAARMTVWPLSADDVGAYVATGEWQGCAGGYRVEGRGQALFQRIEGDRAAIQGLPMQRLVRVLREAGLKLLA